MSDRALVADLLARAAMAHDDDDAQGVANCFTSDGVMEVWMRHEPSGVTVVRGREAIAEHTSVSLSRKSCPRRHALTTSRIEASTQAGEATVHHVRTYLQVWELPPGEGARLVSTATYRDEVTLSDGGALLRRRGIELDSAPFAEPDTKHKPD